MNNNHLHGQSNQAYQPNQQLQQAPYPNTDNHQYNALPNPPPQQFQHFQQQPQQTQQSHEQYYQSAAPLYNYDALPYPQSFQQQPFGQPQQRRWNIPQPFYPQYQQQYHQHQQQTHVGQFPAAPYYTQHQSPPIPRPVTRTAPYVPRLQKQQPSTASSQSSSPHQRKKVKAEKVSSSPSALLSSSSKPNPHKIKEQALVDLSNKFYSHAIAQRKNIKTEKNVQEYFTLVKLAIISLSQVLQMKQKASLSQRIMCNIRIAEILSNEADLNSLSETPETYLDDAILLCGDSLEMKRLKHQAEVTLIQHMIQQGKSKQALKAIASSSFSDTCMLKYLKFTAQKMIDPLQAGQTIKQLLDSTRVVLSEETKYFLELTEISYSLEFGFTPVSELDSITPSSPNLTLWKNFLIVLYEMQYKKSIQVGNSEKLTTSLKLINEVVVNRHNSTLPTDPDHVSFPFEHENVILKVHAMDSIRLNIIFYIIFAVSGMNSTFEKRKSLKVLQLAEKEISESYDVNSPKSSLIEYQELNTHLQDMNTLMTFYSFIESSIADEGDEDASRAASNAVYKKCSDPILLNYVMAIGYHLRGEVDLAMKSYLALAGELEELTPMFKYNDLYLTICLNLFAIIEAQLSRYSSTHDSTKVSGLMALRSQVSDKLERIRTATNTSFQERYLFATTSKFLTLLYNPNNLSIFEIIEQVDKILVDQERLKSYPMLLSMLLYLKSSTLNNNSDQKQKSSQSAFNLAKMGYSPLIRYVSGILNQQNAAIARNDQQFEIQRQKLVKVENKIKFKFGNMFKSQV